MHKQKKEKEKEKEKENTCISWIYWCVYLGRTFYQYNDKIEMQCVTSKVANLFQNSKSCFPRGSNRCLHSFTLFHNRMAVIHDRMAASCGIHTWSGHPSLHLLPGYYTNFRDELIFIKMILFKFYWI